jgi:hypothetical protein
MKNLISAATLMVIMAVGAAIAWSQTTERQQYQNVSRQVYFRAAIHDQRTFVHPGAPQAERIMGELHDMVSTALARTISRRGTSAAAVKKSIEDLQGDDSLANFLPDTQIPFADLTDINGTPSLTVAFAVMGGGDGIPDVRPYVQFYSNTTGQWEMRGEVGSDFNGTAFHVARVKSPISSQVSYLACGVVIGDTGARLKLRLYTFDGYDVKTTWVRDDLRGGTVTISDSGDQITLEYDEPYPEGTTASPRHVTETLRPSMNGLEQ